MEMVDRNARNIAARVLREFMRGSISNEEYEKMYPTSDSDPSLWEIYLQIWFFYSDIREHSLTGKHALNVEQSAFVERCILFLRSDAEFEWPRQRFQPWQAVLQFFGSGKKIGKAAYGDENDWPFLNMTQYEQALKEISDKGDCGV